MYGHITQSGAVGQLFDAKPAAGRYHPSFLQAVRELPDGVTTGWSLDGEQWLPPAPPAAVQGDSFAGLWNVLETLSGAGGDENGEGL